MVGRSSASRYSHIQIDPYLADGHRASNKARGAISKERELMALVSEAISPKEQTLIPDALENLAKSTVRIVLSKRLYH